MLLYCKWEFRSKKMQKNWKIELKGNRGFNKYPSSRIWNMAYLSGSWVSWLWDCTWDPAMKSLSNHPFWAKYQVLEQEILAHIYLHNRCWLASWNLFMHFMSKCAFLPIQQKHLWEIQIHTFLPELQRYAAYGTSSLVK